MTEADQLEVQQIFESLVFFYSNSSDRRNRLFACACCRRVWELLEQASVTNIIELAERYADCEVFEEELHAAQNQPYFNDLNNQLSGKAKVAPRLSLRVLYAVGAAKELTCSTVNTFTVVLNTSKDPTGDYIPTPQHNELTGGGSIKYNRAELAEQGKLLRDIFGNELHPVTFAPAWQTYHTIGIATKMYEERNFDAMPLLADALEEAGCCDPVILSHCREPGVHVRGCWVVDLVLGKE